MALKILFSSLFFFVFLSENIFAAEHLRVVTYNVLYDREPGKDWVQRAPGSKYIMKTLAPDLFGTQETLFHQIETFEQDLPYAYVGVGRDDGQKAGEVTPVFYNKQRFTLIDSSTFWFSPTPDSPGSVGWGATMPRIATWARLRDIHSGTEYFIMNAHLDHLSSESRRKSAKLILERIRQINPTGYILILGDFNASQSGEFYPILNKDNVFVDSETVSEKQVGPWWSFQMFAGLWKRRLDFIFADLRLKVLRHEVVDMKYNNEYPSDHLPVVVDFEVP